MPRRANGLLASPLKLLSLVGVIIVLCFHLSSFMFRFLLAFAVLASASAWASAIPPIPTKIENCGDRFEQFRELFTSVALADKAAQVLTDEAMFAHDAFAPKEPALTPEQKAALQQTFESVFRERASAPGGLVDLAACWHSMVIVPNFDFDGYRDVIVLMQPEMVTLGSQMLDWVGREWCPRVWSSVMTEVQERSTFPVPSFNGMSWCPNRNLQHVEAPKPAKAKVSRRKK